MGLFGIFKKPLKLHDDTFGEMIFCKFKDSSKNFFEGEGFFKPQQKKIGFTIDADETGPTKEQKDFYSLIQGNYDKIKVAIIPFLNKELIDWYEGKSIEDFDNEFYLESITLSRLDKKPIEWSMTYVVKKINHWATIEFADFNPKNVLIDG